MNKFLSIDYGTKKVGIALSDEMKFLAHEYKTIYHNNNDEKVINEIGQIIIEQNVERIILGIPKSMDGSINEQAKIVLKFKKKLLKFEIPIFEVDERLTTSMAKAQLRESGLNEKNMKSVEDARAAAIILQQYLDFYI